jgi:hypothetical protein
MNPAINQAVVPLLFASALAFLGESTTEFLFSVWLDMLAERFPVLAKINPLRYVALGIGVALAFAFDLDLLAVAFPDQVAYASWVGVVLTGVAIGRGSNYVHDLWNRYLKPGEVFVVEIEDGFVEGVLTE